MSYQQGWLVQDRVTVAATWGIVTIEEIGEAAETLHEMLEGVKTQAVFHWVDMRWVQAYPPNIGDMARVARPIQHYKLKLMIVITPDPTLRLVGNAMMRYEQRGFKALLTPNAGLHYLRRLDPTLDLPTLAEYEVLIDGWVKGHG